MSEQLVTENVRHIVYPFAELRTAPSWVEPKPEDLIALQGLFGARDHMDFSPHSARDYTGTFDEPNHCLRLPMQLALGLHSAGPQQINSDRLQETFDTYSSIRDINGFAGGEKVHHQVQREKAEQILSATIVSAALSDHWLKLTTSRSAIAQAIDASVANELISKHRARKIRGAVKLVDV